MSETLHSNDGKQPAAQQISAQGDESFAQWMSQNTGSALSLAEADKDELVRVQDALRNYREVSLQWAERRSATKPSLAAAARRNQFWAAVPQWSLAAVAAVTVATGIAHFTGSSSAPAASSRVADTTTSEPVASAEQLAADDHLMVSIDSALQYSTPVAGYNLDSSSSPMRAIHNTAGTAN